MKSQSRLKGLYAFVCIALVLSLLTATFGQGRRRNSGGTNEVATLYDSGTRPMVASRVLYILDERFATIASRPLLAVQVSDNQQITGYIFPTREDIEGTDFPRDFKGDPLPIYIEGVEGGTPGQTGRWVWPPDQFTTGQPLR